MASFGLTTSQFVTAPKRTQGQTVIKVCLTTSQFVTAPKRFWSAQRSALGLTTSQFVTAPKPLGQNPLCRRMDKPTGGLLHD